MGPDSSKDHKLETRVEISKLLRKTWKIIMRETEYTWGIWLSACNMHKVLIWKRRASQKPLRSCKIFFKPTVSLKRISNKGINRFIF